MNYGCIVVFINKKGDIWIFDKEEGRCESFLGGYCFVFFLFLCVFYLLIVLKIGWLFFVVGCCGIVIKFWLVLNIVLFFF